MNCERTPRPRLPGYSLPRRRWWHWFIQRREPGVWITQSTGSLFNPLSVKYRDPGTRLFLAIRRRENER
jgi:hypothetical protein